MIFLAHTLQCAPFFLVVHMRVEIISIGDEILSGNILDTNKQYISNELWQLGFSVDYHSSVRDDEADIRQSLLCAADRAQYVVCTGGLGPTVDDFTVEVAAKTFNLPLIEDESTVVALKDFFAKLGRELKANNLKQAMVPEGAIVFPNRKGTAPGMAVLFQKTWFYFLPGVPREMIDLMQQEVLPHIQRTRTDGLFFATRFLRTFGCPESDLDDRLKDLFFDRVKIQNARIGFRAQNTEVCLKVSVWHVNQLQAYEQLEEVLQLIRSRIGEFIYAEDENTTLESLVVNCLSKAKLTLAVAESCTGGLIAHRITNIPGASAVFLGGYVTYSNELKSSALGVSSEIIQKYGAVSEECARAMVTGVFDRTGADYCIAVTGIAGPTGGSVDKPVGTVHIALKSKSTIEHEKFVLPFGREMFKTIVASFALKRVLAKING